MQNLKLIHHNLFMNCLKIKALEKNNKFFDPNFKDNIKYDDQSNSSSMKRGSIVSDASSRDRSASRASEPEEQQ